LNCLAAGDALRALAGHRRAALWESVVSAPERGLLKEAQIHEQATPELPLRTEGQSMVADYRTLGLTLGRHPLALLRDKLTAMRFSASGQLRQQPDRRLVRACGIVTGRQRPGTSTGVVCVTLEDEDGHIGLIVWPKIIERQRKALLPSRLFGAYGTWQSENGG